MTLKCGIVGLPNVGKSTLFNALTASQAAAAANYPFCTIEPNTGITAVPDERLEQLASIAGSGKIIPAYIEFVDIAGLVAGASKGEGLGNKFLSHIREVDAILHVLRCFKDDDITHVHGAIDPLHDAEIIETELILADLESVERRLAATKKRLKTGDKALNAELDLLQAIYQLLSAGKPARDLVGAYDKSEISKLQLLTAKPVLYVCNVLEQEACDGNEFTNNIADKAKKEQAESIIISSKIEAEIANLASVQEKIEFLDSIGLAETGLSKIIKSSYNLLDLQSFFTVGPKEVHAWTFKVGTLAPEAAGIIHTDFEKGFIRAEVISYNDYISCRGEVRAKEIGKMRLEGKEYRVQGGDIMHFRFNL
ncbi:redox-regulated ATPase YchF [Candidatus Trichorickettsia mobilis]|uniref:redox-regulated ATPase YchF n=1 Tax=Candidatus Trichorickettsia mobilis TaxID=1346319 RepID=UPI00292F092C|nr:redox-regulated ATPase YchF [Candidatus Trichorickettsia mobilis]